MGAVNKIPGVSGGTVAFITGIYEDLINSIKKTNFKSFKILFNYLLNSPPYKSSRLLASVNLENGLYSND